MRIKSEQEQWHYAYGGRGKHSVVSNDDRTIAEVIEGRERGREEGVAARARILAAAPDLLDSLVALGVMPEGYCFCFGNNRDPMKTDHTGECRLARLAINKAHGT